MRGTTTARSTEVNGPDADQCPDQQARGEGERAGLQQPAEPAPDIVADLQECDDDGAALVYGQHLYNSYDCRYNDGTGQWDLYVTPWP